jgi:iron complex transport system substrate-binding protein
MHLSFSDRAGATKAEPYPRTLRDRGAGVRRAIPAAVLAALLVGLAGCGSGNQDAAGSGSESASDSGFPVTVEHVYGKTTLESAPERVATVSWVNHDVAAALGTVPVDIAASDFGGDADGTTPWFDAAVEGVGGQTPAIHRETDGIDYESLAASAPDVILAAYSGITQEEYDKLSKIAPVVAYPADSAAFGTSWQESTRLIGQALGKDSEAEELIADVEGQIEDTAQEYPELDGSTFIYGNIDPAAADQIILYTALDNRPRFLSSLGMEPAPSVAEELESAEGFSITWSPERADELEADVLVSWAADDSVGTAISEDPLLGSIPAVEAGTMVLQTDDTETLSLSAASPLSIPWALENVVPDIAAAAKKADEGR